MACVGGSWPCVITARVVRAVEVCNLGASYPVAHQLLALGRYSILEGVPQC